jgi:hypothetical protein
MSLLRYNILLKKQKKSVGVPSIKTHLPNPTDGDYNKGYIKRYFVQKANDKDSQIFEVSQVQYSSYSNLSYYLLVSIDWRVRGNVEEVKYSNKESIKIVYGKMPKLSLYLPNLLQFYRK